MGWQQKQSMVSRRQACKGVTVLQLAIATAAIMFVTIGAYFASQLFGEKAKKAVAAYNMQKIREALQKYAHDHGYYPHVMADLTREVAGGLSYLEEIPIDPTTRIADWEILKGSSDASIEVSFADPNLQQHLRMNDGAGPTATDDTGNGNNAPLNGGSAWSTGIDGGGIFFDGGNDWLDLDNGAGAWPLFDNQWGVRTVLVWYNSADNTGYRFIYEEGGSVNGACIYIFNGNIYVGAWSESLGWNGAWLNTPTDTGNWHQVGFVFDSGAGTFQLFYDGAFVGAPAAAPVDISAHSGNDAIGCNVDSTKTHVGDDGGGPEYWFNGNIDEFMVYNRTLSAAEILNNYNYFTTPPTPAAVWREYEEDIIYTGEILDIRSNNPEIQDF